MFILNTSSDISSLELKVLVQVLVRFLNVLIYLFVTIKVKV